MREDNIGLFWHDKTAIKGPKKGPPVKRVPPVKTWGGPDYLPGLAEAQTFAYPEWTSCNGPLVCDIEVFENYFLVAFLCMDSGQYARFELDDKTDFNADYVRWVLANYLIITFNGNFFDLPILALALAGHDCAQLKEDSDMLIQERARPAELLKEYKVEKLKVNHIDLIEVCPLNASLKIYGGRLHTPRMRELPFDVNTILSEEQKTIIRYYNYNDLKTTILVADNLKNQINLRDQMSIAYGLDLRSKSDAQVAEAVITSELTMINRLRPQRPEILPGTVYKYNIPSFLKFDTPIMQMALSTIRAANFVVDEGGVIGKPPSIEALDIVLDGASYTLGIGGLHSCETCIGHQAGGDLLLLDRDVSSYYPQIILNQQLYPEHLGRNFLTVYQRIVDRRLTAKRLKNKIEAEFLKIVVNGSFGKFGSPWSVLYAPQLLIQVTMTGQLALLMLIERLGLAGITVASANTDGILIKCPTALQSCYSGIVKQWEMDVGGSTEETEYKWYYARDVNNYLALKLDGSTKGKGAYNNPWGSTDPGQAIFRFHKNPVSTICIEAVTAFLKSGVPLKTTIEACVDITRFVTIRTVKGGAVQGSEYLGKAIRWYYSREQLPEMVYVLSGNKVPNSDGAKPLMDLPATLPEDLDLDYYWREAAAILVAIGRWPAPPKAPRLSAAQAKAAARLLPSPAPLSGGVWL